MNSVGVPTLEFRDEESSTGTATPKVKQTFAQPENFPMSVEYFFVL